MKLLLKFKDGIVIQQDLDGTTSFLSGNETLIEILRKAKEQNGPIILDNENIRVERRFEELYSVEILMD